MATGRRIPEDDTDIEIKVCKAIVTPHPSLAIIRFWQGAVEILLRVTCMVRRYSPQKINPMMIKLDNDRLQCYHHWRI